MATDPVMAALLGQVQRQRVGADPRTSLASRLMQVQPPAAPITNPGAGWAYALTQGLNAFTGARMMRDAEERQRQSEEAGFNRLRDYTREREAAQMEELRTLFPGLGGAPQAPQGAPATPAPMPQQAPPMPAMAPRGEAPPAVAQGIAARQALDPNAPDYPERIMQINNGVVAATMPGQRPQPVAPQGQPQQRPQLDPAVLAMLAGRGNPMAAAMLPVIAAQQSRQDTQEFQREQARQRQLDRDAAAQTARDNRPPQFVQTDQGVMQVMPDGSLRRAGGLPREAQQGPFAGNSMEAQSLRILLDPNSDPSSPAYGAAFNNVYGPRTVTQADGTVVVTQNPVPEGIRRPGAAPLQAPAQPQAAAPTTSAPTVPSNTSIPGGGIVTRIPGPPPNLTEAQARSNMFGAAMEQGDRILSGDPANNRPGLTVPNAATLLAWRNLPEGAVNMALGENDQQYFNALRSFAAGILRKETGAAFTAQELLDVQSRFFPMPGDAPAVIEQKSRARRQAIESMRAEIPGGFRGVQPPPAGAPIGQTGMTAEPPASTRPAPPAVGTVISGYRFRGGEPSQRSNWERVEQ